jgi:hypothetical protein
MKKYIRIKSSLFYLLILKQFIFKKMSKMKYDPMKENENKKTKNRIIIEVAKSYFSDKW